MSRDRAQHRHPLGRDLDAAFAEHICRVRSHDPYLIQYWNDSKSGPAADRGTPTVES
jgi:hypothetical protein